MNEVTLQIELASWWHAGSGESGGADLDALVARDTDGLPFLPGKTLKGLLRDAARLHQACSGPGPDLRAMFGQEGGDPASPPARLEIASAHLPEQFRKWAVANKPLPELEGESEILASTAIASGRGRGVVGIALEKSLRKIEVIIPLTLEATISWKAKDGDVDIRAWLEQIVRLVRRLGSHRHRGLGRCRVTLKTESPHE